MGLALSNVRVHTDERAARSARAVDALAYTSGRHIVFGRGQYAPETDSGRRLLGHELVHVAQQAAGRPGLPAPKTLDPPNHPREAEADRVADALMSNSLSPSWSIGTTAASPVVSRVGTVRCTAGRNSAPSNARAVLEATETIASLACTTASMHLTILELSCMRGLVPSAGYQVPTTTERQDYENRFGLPPRVSGGYRNRLDSKVYRTQGEALMREARSLSGRYSRLSSRLLGSIAYRCIRGRTTWDSCVGHCSGRDATACGTHRIMLCPAFWRLSLRRAAQLLIHEAGHLVFGIRHGRNFRHADCYAAFAADAGGRASTTTPVCRS
jgi:hypothetical protein